MPAPLPLPMMPAKAAANEAAGAPVGLPLPPNLGGAGPAPAAPPMAPPPMPAPAAGLPPPVAPVPQMPGMMPPAAPPPPPKPEVRMQEDGSSVYYILSPEGKEIVLGRNEAPKMPKALQLPMPPQAPIPGVM